MAVNLIARKSAASTKEYFSRRDADHQIPPVWIGKGLESLGIEAGEVAALKPFNRLIDNKSPVEGVQLTPRQRSDRVAALELNFNPPKSVSLAIEFDPSGSLVRDAFVSAVRDTMTEVVEPLAAVRVRKGGVYEDRVTGNVAGVMHIHALARPVNGVPMPQWHSHVVLGNVTYDNVEKVHKALKQHSIFKHAPEIEKSFHDKLRQYLHNIGYRTEGKGRNWGIVGISKATERKFSERKTVIDKFKETAKVWRPQYAALTTREEKVDIPIEELRAIWKDKLTDREKESFEYLRARPKLARFPEAIKRRAKHLALVQKVMALSQEKELTHERREVR